MKTGKNIPADEAVKIAVQDVVEHYSWAKFETMAWDIMTKMELGRSSSTNASTFFGLRATCEYM